MGSEGQTLSSTPIPNYCSSTLPPEQDENSPVIWRPSIVHYAPCAFVIVFVCLGVRCLLFRDMWLIFDDTFHCELFNSHLTVFGAKKLFYKILQGEQGVLFMDTLVGLGLGLVHIPLHQYWSQTVFSLFYDNNYQLQLPLDTYRYSKYHRAISLGSEFEGHSFK